MMTKMDQKENKQNEKDDGEKDSSNRQKRRKSKCRESANQAALAVREDRGKLADLESGLDFLSAYVSENQASPPLTDRERKKLGASTTQSKQSVLGVIEGKSNSRLEAKLFSLLAEVDSSDDEIPKSPYGASSPRVRVSPCTTPVKKRPLQKPVHERSREKIGLKQSPAKPLKGAAPAPSHQLASGASKGPQGLGAATRVKPPVPRKTSAERMVLLPTPASEPRMVSTLDPSRLEGIQRHQKAVERQNKLKQQIAEQEKAQRQFRARPLPAAHRRRKPNPNDVPPVSPSQTMTSDPSRYKTLGDYADEHEKQEFERSARRRPPIPDKSLNSKSARESPALIVKRSLPKRPFSSGEHLQESSSRLQLAGQGSLSSPVKSEVFNKGRGDSVMPIQMEEEHFVEKFMGDRYWPSSRPPSGMLSTARRMSAHSEMLARQKEYLERKRQREVEGLKKKADEELEELKKQPVNRQSQESWQKAKMQNMLLRQREEMEQRQKEEMIQAKMIAARKLKREEAKKRKEEELKRERLRKRLAKRAADATAARVAAEQTQAAANSKVFESVEPLHPSANNQVFGPKKLQAGGGDSMVAPSISSWDGKTEANSVLFNDAINKLMDVEEEMGSQRMPQPGINGMVNEMAALQMEGENRGNVKKSYEDLEWERMYAEYKEKREKEEKVQLSGTDLSDGMDPFQKANVNSSDANLDFSYLDIDAGGHENNWHEHLVDVMKHTPREYVEDTNNGMGDVLYKTYGLKTPRKKKNGTLKSHPSSRQQNRGKESPAKPPTSRNDVGMAPYQKYENGLMDFFDKSSSADKGRFRVHDAKLFQPDSMHRKPDTATAQGGVTLLMGERMDKPGEEQVITVLFDRSIFSEEDAKVWWSYNRDRFI